MDYFDGSECIKIELNLHSKDAKHMENNKVGSTLVIEDEVEDRYSRLRLIPWWDQDKLKNARVMVVGAGALGNEILKNLALLGAGNIFIIDIDSIENSNLSRSVLYRVSDKGKGKAEIAALRVKEINPDININFFNGNVVYDLGLGVFRSMDVIIGGLDNREARLAINRNCWKVNKPWIDGAIEVLSGVARVFIPPYGACYECTMNRNDFKALRMRRSCALLTRDEMSLGKIPTTPTVSSIIAGVQVQEAVKLIHKRESVPAMNGKGFVYNGVAMDTYVVEYPRRESCMSHETYEDIISLDISSRNTTIKAFMDFAKVDFSQNTVLEFEREIVCGLHCKKCGAGQKIFKALGKVTEKEGKCPMCGDMRLPELTHTIYGNEDYLDMTFSEIGIPLMDIVTARDCMKVKHYEFTKDKEYIIGNFK